MRCGGCGRDIDDGSRFCPSCGASVGGGGAEPVPTMETAPVVEAGQGSGGRGGGSRGEHGRFEPGTRLGERYRIVGLLGRGGMGEVYRADDLELGQSVALKFLPERVSADPVALERFRGEVRLARQIAHPNVCRIYDIGQVDEHVFLSMEYIDGEDLAHVLRRMGRPSKEKAVEIARQLCFGLAAAHEAGILHRDLKPANVMIDGRGRVRVTDFGLAGLAEELEGGGERAGTPAYMAPEQLERGEVSVQSDIYSLGLILYEVFTGRRALNAESVAELRELHLSSSVTSPTSFVDDVDPAVERVVLRCLEREADARPGSVYGVLAALPGGDPLAAALAAGETPSPELVAHAGARGGLSVRTAGWLAAWIGVVALCAVMIGSTRLVPRESGVVLSAKAGEMMRALGYGELPENTAWGFEENRPYLERLRESGDTSWSGLASGRPSAIIFWRRWSPKPLGATDDFHMAFPTRTDPPQTSAGSITIGLDNSGRLAFLDVVADPEAPAAEDGEAYWGELLEQAGVSAYAAASDAAVGLAHAHSDAVRVWEVRAPEEEGGSFVAEAGAFRGRPVWFEMRWAGAAPDAAGGAERSTLIASVTGFLGSVFGLFSTILWPFIMFASAVLAIRNARAGRVDRGGALRAGLLMFGLYAVSEGVNFRLGELGLAQVFMEMSTGRSLGHALVHGFQIWLGYLAVEPYVRRIWPRLLVAWVRLMSGRWRDPLVGREVLIGLSLGMVIYLGKEGADVVAGAMGVANFAPIAHFYPLHNITSPSLQIYTFCLAGTGGLLLVMFELVLLLVFRMLTGRTWLALVIGIMFYVAGAQNWYFGTEYSEAAPMLPTVLWSLVYAVVVAIALLRFGLVCALMAHVGSTLLVWMVGTTDLRDWHATPMLVMLAAVGVLTAYGVWASIRGRSGESVRGMGGWLIC